MLQKTMWAVVAAPDDGLGRGGLQKVEDEAVLELAAES